MNVKEIREQLGNELTELKFKIQEIKKQLKIFWKAGNADKSFETIEKIGEIIKDE